MSRFPGQGYYRGNIDALVKDSIKAFDALPLDKQQEMRALQRESWVRGEMGIGLDANEEKYRADHNTAADSREVLEQIPAPLAASTSETFTQVEQARASGYTGDQCTNCNSLKMRVSGHCLCCDDCGTTTGCS